VAQASPAAKRRRRPCGEIGLGRGLMQIAAAIGISPSAVATAGPRRPVRGRRCRRSRRVPPATQVPLASRGRGRTVKLAAQVRPAPRLLPSGGRTRGDGGGRRKRTREERQGSHGAHSHGRSIFFREFEVGRRSGGGHLAAGGGAALRACGVAARCPQRSSGARAWWLWLRGGERSLGLLAQGIRRAQRLVLASRPPGDLGPGLLNPAITARVPTQR
jgi:hypothetical protein